MHKKICFPAILIFFVFLRPALGLDYPSPVPRTGRITSFAAGDDGLIQAGVVWPEPRFEWACDGASIDRLTGLIWANDANLMVCRDPGFDIDQVENDGRVFWSHALAYIQKLNSEDYLGHNDWRLPNINELESLWDAQQHHPALPQGTLFYNVPYNNTYNAKSYWTSTTFAGDKTHAWIVDSDQIYLHPGVFRKKGFTNHVWPVRGGWCDTDNGSVVCLPKTGQIESWAFQDDGFMCMGLPWPEPRFTDHGDNTTTDNLTGLMWPLDANLIASRNPEFDTDNTSGDGRVVWTRAMAFVAMLNGENYLGYNDWRLPNRRELRSIIDYSRFHPALPQDHPFRNVQPYFYWSSTTRSDVASFAWVVDIHYGGNTSFFYKNDHYCLVLPVRAGVLFDPITTTTTTTETSSTTTTADSSSTSTTTEEVSSTTTTTKESGCRMRIIPARIHPLAAELFPVRSFIFIAQQGRAFTRESRPAWDQTGAVTTLWSAAVGRKALLVLAKMHLGGRKTGSFHAYVDDCEGEIIVK